jgi:hypothetical protein
VSQKLEDTPMPIANILSGLSLIQSLLSDKKKTAREAEKDSAIMLRKAAENIRILVAGAEQLHHYLASGPSFPEGFEQEMRKFSSACVFLSMLHARLDKKNPAAKELFRFFRSMEMRPAELGAIYNEYCTDGTLRPEFIGGIRNKKRREDVLKSYSETGKNRRSIVDASTELAAIAASYDACATLLEAGLYKLPE